MKEETKKIIGDSISDVGYWRWWATEDDIYQIEFGGVQLFDEKKTDRSARSSVIALRFSGDAFVQFLDNFDGDASSEVAWYEKLHRDQLDPFSLEHDEFIFDNLTYAKEIYQNFRNRSIFPASATWEHIEKSKHLLAFKCNDVGLIIGGNQFAIVGSGGAYTEDEIVSKNKDWWAYWKDYWKVKETNDAYEKDYACEVTIPIKESAPITAKNLIVNVRIDEELGEEGFTYSMASGNEGTVHIEQVLDYNKDPSYLRDMILYKLTLDAQRQISRTLLSKREIIRRLGTSAPQLYRLLDQTNYKKSLDQMLILLNILDCDIDVIVKAKSA